MNDKSENAIANMPLKEPPVSVVMATYHGDDVKHLTAVPLIVS